MDTETPSRDSARSGPRFIARLKGWFDLPLNTGEQYTFHFDEPYRTTVLLRARQAEEKLTEWGTRYEVSAERPIGRELNEQLSALAAGRMPRGSVAHREGVNTTDGAMAFYHGIADDGTFDPTTPAQWDLLPEAVAALFYGSDRVDYAHALRVASVIQWRYGWSVHRIRTESESAEWSIDGRTWRPWPTSLDVRLGGGPAIRLSPEAESWVLRTASSGNGEPPAHELLREATDLIHESSRAAVVLAAAALETGVKACIQALTPEAAWLLRQRASPPVLQLLNAYLPTIASRLNGGTAFGLKGSSYKDLESAIALRNNLVHGGAERPDVESTERFVERVRDVLYLLDYYTGQDWAIRHLREGFKREIGMPVERHD